MTKAEVNISDQADKILEVRNLKTYFKTHDGLVKAVDDVSFDVFKGKVLGVVGESGCGKSITAFSILQLVPSTGKIEGGEIIYTKDNEKILLTDLPPHSKEIRKIRGNEIAMVFQEPMTAFSPVYTVGNQIMEAVMLHQNINQEKARERTVEMLTKVGISAPDQRVDEYPHGLSGGMRQRAMIAMALSCNPNLLIADEPTTALDVTIEAQILTLLRNLQKEFNMAIMMITHDLGVIGEMSDEVIVMYMGKIVEYSDVHTIFYNPKHPYTIGLLSSIPLILPQKQRLNPIRGSIPNIQEMPDGCLFEPRCSKAFKKCKQKPPLFEVDKNHLVKCWLYERGDIDGRS